MKHTACIVFTVLLLSVFLLPITVYSASSSYTVDKVDFNIELSSDGSALISEEWTLTVEENCRECFSRDIFVIDDNFERIDGMSDLSVSLDGNNCSEEKGDVLREGTYFYTETDCKYSVSWFIPESGTHTFFIRYVLNDVVKIYNDKAYFYCRPVNEDSNLICRNVTVKISTPSQCFAEDFEITESGLLAGTKTENCVTFFASNTAGAVKVGIAMPSEVFNVSKLTHIIDDNSVYKIVLSVLGVFAFIAIALGLFFAIKHEKLVRSYRENRCKKKLLDESTEKTQRMVFSQISPAELIKTVLPNTVNDSDYFIVTVLELYTRGYIKVTSHGFDTTENSMTDSCKRVLNKNEKRILHLFNNSRWEKFISEPKAFYNEIQSFNKNVKCLSMLNDFSSKGKKLVRRCFEIKLGAKRFDYVTPQEVSDSLFRNEKYNIGDLVISIINEFSLNSVEKEHNDKFKFDMFMFRDIYTEGESLVIQQEKSKRNR